VTSSPYISVVLPAHNEAELIETAVGGLAKSLRDQARDFEIVIVENGSTDRTADLARRIAEEMPEVRLYELPQADYGAAVAAGFSHARGDIVVHFDVDLIDLGFLDKGVALVEEGRAGIVLASKRAPGSNDERPVYRRLLTAGFTLGMRVLLAVPVSDAHGMKVLSRQQCATAAAACQMRGALYDVELVLRASRQGVVIRELPTEVREIRPPRSSVWQRSLEGATGLVRLRILLWRERPR
jgi:glycosyltransferase involved in cell wall biosynthesis